MARPNSSTSVAACSGNSNASQRPESAVRALVRVVVTAAPSLAGPLCVKDRPAAGYFSNHSSFSRRSANGRGCQPFTLELMSRVCVEKNNGIAGTSSKKISSAR